MLPVFICATVYWYAYNMDIAYGAFPIEKAIQFVENSQNINEVKAFSVTSMNNYLDSNNGHVNTYYSFLDMLIAVTLLNTLCVYLIYKYSKKVSKNV